MLTSTLFFCPHSLHSLVSVLLAPGTQWSHTPRVSLPAAEEWLTNGAHSCAAAPKAVVLSRFRLERAARRIVSSLQFFPFQCLQSTYTIAAVGHRHRGRGTSRRRGGTGG